MLFIYLSLIDSEENKDKFETLYLRHRKLMKHIALDILDDEYAAEDAVHNAFLKIIANIDKFSEEDCQENKNLIVIIIRNSAIDMYRKRNREFENTDVLNMELPTETDFSVVEVEEILREIETLPKIYRDVLLLKIEYDYKDRDIAKLLGINVDTVSKRIERARKQLKQQIFKEVYHNEEP